MHFQVPDKFEKCFYSTCFRILSNINLELNIIAFPLTADVVAQALDVLQSIVKDDEGRGLFLKYKALSTILTLLRIGGPGLLAPSLDVLLQMSADSRKILLIYVQKKKKRSANI